MKLILIPTIFLVAGLLAAPFLSAEEGFSSLEEQMTGKEFQAAGLDKLTAAELQALNNWIRGHSLATLDGAAVAGTAAVASTADDRRGLKSEKEDEDRSTINSRILGAFSGWDGQTVFKLENGMIWAQVDKDKFWIKEIENPEVVIEPGLFGTWRLSVEGYNSDCRVERIQ
jgi:hypothetical protein